MFYNTNAFPLLAVSALLLLGQLCHGRAIPASNVARRDVSDIVRREHGATYRRDAKGFVQPIWLSDDGSMYYTNVSIGTPKQPLTLAISMTGTTWAPTLPAGETEESYCTDTANVLACEYAHISGFYTLNSSTYSPKENITNLAVGEDKISGTLAVDTVELGTTALANVGILIAESWRSPPQLSLSATPATNDSGPQLLSVLKQARIINTLTYSLSFGSVDGDGNPDYGRGDIAFGGVDESQFFGELSAFTANAAGVVPVSDLYWISTAKKNVSMIDEGSKAGQLGVGEVAMTPYLWLEDDMFKIVISLFGDTTKTETGYTAACDNNVRSLQFSIDGTVITLQSTVLQTPSADPSICTIAIRPRSEYPVSTTADYILGFPFLYAAYTVLDYTHGQTFIAARNVVPSSILTPVGVDNAAVSADGATLTTSIHPATSTIYEAPIQTTSTSISTSAGTSTSIGISARPTTEIDSKSKSTKYEPNNYNFVGPVVGGVVGGVVFIALIIVFKPLVKAAMRRRERRDRDDREMAMQRRRVGDHDVMAPIDLGSDVGSVDGDEDDDEKDAELIAAAIAMSISDAEGDTGDERDPGEAKRDSITIDIHGMDSVTIDPSTVGVAISSPPAVLEDTETETETDKESEDESEDENVKAKPEVNEAPSAKEKKETETTSPDGDGH
ncbi:Barrierpepsin [Orbilia brochopaga]|nr:Barrierpepsin [Drechslerella brochopaga]